MKLLALSCAFLAVALTSEGAWARDTLVAAVSSDSLPGWKPTSGEQKEALRVARAYLAAIDRGAYAQAYAMLSDGTRALAPVAAFAAMERAFSAKAGPTIQRRATAITWTNHADGGSDPGVFAAIDYVERYKNIDRACSYLVLVEAADGSGLRVNRRQTGTLDNATASSIAAKGSPSAVEDTWRLLARQYPHCPS